MAGQQQSLTITTPAGGPDAPQDDKLILGKFKTPEELAAAYKELEAKLGGAGGTPKPGSQSQQQPAQDKGGLLTIEDASTILTEKGLDYVKYASEYAEHGHLSSSSYAEILGKGISASQIDSFIAGQAPVIAAQKSVREKEDAEIVESVGGKDAYGQLIEFAKVIYSPTEVQQFNAAIKSRNKIAVKAMLSVLKQQYVDTYGQEPNLGGGTGRVPAGPQGDIFHTRAEYHEAVADPKYRTSTEYRRKVDEKLVRSHSHWK